MIPVPLGLTELDDPFRGKEQVLHFDVPNSPLLDDRDARGRSWPLPMNDVVFV